MTESSNNITKYNNPDMYMDKMRKIVEAHGAKLLSTKWCNAKSKYKIELVNGTIIETAYQNIIRRSQWKIFPTYGDIDINSIEFLSKYAEKNNGKLISKQLMGINDKYLFEDYNGTRFELSIKQIKLKKWTPDRGLVTEPICRQVMEHLFGYPFKKTKDILTPEILNRNKPLELDGYCKELNLAFEYQGYPGHWDKNHYKYEIVSKRDILKKETCEKLGIVLFIIPVIKESKNKWSDNEIFNHVLNVINNTYIDLNINSPHLNIHNFKIDFSKINYGKEKINNLSLIAENNNCKLLSKVWNGDSFRYDFINKEGLTFKISNKYLRNNGWPKDIDKYLNAVQRVQNKEFHIRKIISLAKENGFTLIDNEWHGKLYSYLFKDSNNNQYKISYSYLKKEGWPTNINKFLFNSIINSKCSLNDLKIISEKHNAVLLSDSWKNSSTHYDFLLNDGRNVSIKANYIFKNGWPNDIDKFINNQAIYKKSPDLLFNEFKTLIESHNAILLEDKWLGFKKKHKVLLENQEEIFISPMNAKRNKTIS